MTDEEIRKHGAECGAADAAGKEGPSQDCVDQFNDSQYAIWEKAFEQANQVDY